MSTTVAMMTMADQAYDQLQPGALNSATKKIDPKNPDTRRDEQADAKVAGRETATSKVHPARRAARPRYQSPRR